jgi:hypothetical protein
MLIVSSTLNYENYKKHLFELKKMCNEIYSSSSEDFDIWDDEDFIQKFVQNYNFVVRYYVYSLAEKIYSRNELIIPPFGSSRPQFQARSHQDLELFNRFIGVDLLDGNKWLRQVWNLFCTGNSSGILFHEINESVKQLKEKKPNTAGIDVNLENLVYIFNGHSADFLEYLSAREALFSTFEKLENFLFFNSTLFEVIVTFDAILVQVLLELLEFLHAYIQLSKKEIK